MTYRNTETGVTRGSQGFVRHLTRHGSIEKDITEDGEIVRAVIDLDGTREEWVLIDEDS